MSAYREEFQFTFRVVDSIWQYHETAYTEDEAREALARILLVREGVDPKAVNFEELVAEYLPRLRLMYFR